jgi:hypothetical protein
MQRAIVPIKRALERKVGFTLDSVSRCRQAEQWLKKHNVDISYSTLSRIFGLNGQQVIPRKQTLNELAKAVGFPDFEMFCSSLDARPSLVRFQNETLFQLEVLLASGATDEALSFFLDALRMDSTHCFLSLHLGKFLYRDKERYHKELIRLAQEPIARDYFFQFYIDEDDTDGAFSHSLEKVFLQGANAQERMFVQLYLARKHSMKGFLIDRGQIDEWLEYAQQTESLHLKSRAWEVYILQEWLRDGSLKEQSYMKYIEESLQWLQAADLKGEESALVGRLCRSMILTQSGRAAFENSQWITHCRQVVFGSFSDLEFQSATQRFLQQGTHFLSNDQMIYQSDWPNAYFTAQLFLQDRDLLKRNQNHLSALLQVNKAFIENITKESLVGRS